MKTAPGEPAPKKVRGGGGAQGQAAELRGFRGAVPEPLEAPSVARAVQRTPPAGPHGFCQPVLQACLDVLVSRAWRGVNCPSQGSGRPWKGGWKPHTWLMKE